MLPGYVPRYLETAGLDVDSSRAIDIGYRSRAMPFDLGDLGQDKIAIAERFQALARAQGLATDISVLERDRLYGRQWVRFLRDCRCVLGTSSGASVVDFTGDIRRSCERYLALNPDAGYGDVKARFFADADWKVVIDTVSPRVFEAAALGCTLVQHEGLYGGVIRADEHFISVRRDYSNVGSFQDRAPLSRETGCGTAPSVARWRSGRIETWSRAGAMASRRSRGGSTAFSTSTCRAAAAPDRSPPCIFTAMPTGSGGRRSYPGARRSWWRLPPSSSTTSRGASSNGCRAPGAGRWRRG